MAKNKNGFFSLLLKSIKDAIANYKAYKQELKEKRKFNLASDFDWLLLEQWIKKINDNPQLKVVIKKPNGTVIHINTYQPEEKVGIDKLLNEVTFEEL